LGDSYRNFHKEEQVPRVRVQIEKDSFNFGKKLTRQYFWAWNKILIKQVGDNTAGIKGSIKYVSRNFKNSLVEYKSLLSPPSSTHFRIFITPNFQFTSNFLNYTFFSIIVEPNFRSKIFFEKIIPKKNQYNLKKNTIFT
jgi:hypothetical protein